MFFPLCYQLELRSEGKYVVVGINNKVELVVGMESDQTEEVLTGKIRLALGGMLVDQKRLLHPVSQTMLHFVLLFCSLLWCTVCMSVSSSLAPALSVSS